ncbi:response regulator transcription factor [Bacillus sp. FSL W7-1360]
MKLILADDHRVVRQGLIYFLEAHPHIEVIAEASNGQEAVDAYITHRPDMIIMDIDMPILDGVAATEAILAHDPKAHVFILTSFSAKDFVINALRAGACGYQLKDVEPDILVETLEAALRGEAPLHPRVLKHVRAHVATPESDHEQKLTQLTRREREVLQEICAGKSNKEIAATLVISEPTVKTHVSNIFGKLDVQDRTQAALFAIQAGLVEPNLF